MIFHLVAPDIWQQVSENYQPESLKTEGFIHFSTEKQVAATYKRFYSNRPMLLLTIDESKLVEELKYEAADGDLYPHLYGALNLDAVIKVEKYKNSLE